MGHFTAMVWKNATKVGFGYAIGKADGWDMVYVVARYSPPTNYIGQEVANVGLPIKNLLSEQTNKPGKKMTPSEPVSTEPTVNVTTHYEG